eukprot:TRINITY_DN11566_c0_g1_i1.p1 TRINITY_DN11566_c0_g1~~TRINITY_DN11566_c0_g1_i1.p1  ORF type:complete len:898 (-),score=196.09 TRINITY_DN11566_c0_g1_i1:34-2685(-)
MATEHTDPVVNTTGSQTTAFSAANPFSPSTAASSPATNPFAATPFSTPPATSPLVFTSPATQSVPSFASSDDKPFAAVSFHTSAPRFTFPAPTFPVFGATQSTESSPQGASVFPAPQARVKPTTGQLPTPTVANPAVAASPMIQPFSFAFAQAQAVQPPAAFGAPATGCSTSDHVAPVMPQPMPSMLAAAAFSGLAVPTAIVQPKPVAIPLGAIFDVTSDFAALSTAEPTDAAAVSDTLPQRSRKHDSLQVTRGRLSAALSDADEATEATDEPLPARRAIRAKRRDRAPDAVQTPLAKLRFAVQNYEPRFPARSSEDHHLAAKAQGYFKAIKALLSENAFAEEDIAAAFDTLLCSSVHPRVVADAIQIFIRHGAELTEAHLDGITDRLWSATHSMEMVDVLTVVFTHFAPPLRQQLLDTVLERGAVMQDRRARRTLLEFYEQFSDNFAGHGAGGFQIGSRLLSALHDEAIGSEGYYVQLLSLLMNRAIDVNARAEPTGLTCLHSCALAQNMAAVAMLIKRGANVSLQTPDGETAYSLLTGSGTTDFLSYDLFAALHAAKCEKQMTLLNPQSKVRRIVKLLQADGTVEECRCKRYSRSWQVTHPFEAGIMFSGNDQYCLVLHEENLAVVYAWNAAKGIWTSFDRREVKPSELDSVGAVSDNGEPIVFNARKYSCDTILLSSHVQPRVLYSNPLSPIIWEDREKFDIPALAYLGTLLGADDRYWYHAHIPKGLVVARTSRTTMQTVTLRLTIPFNGGSLSRDAQYLLVWSDYRMVAVNTDTWKVMRLIGLEAERHVFAGVTNDFKCIIARTASTTVYYDIPATLTVDWTPERHAGFPEPFRQAVRCVMLCAQCNQDGEPYYPQCGLWMLPMEILYEIFERLATDY